MGARPTAAAVRIVISLSISAVFAAATLSRVDLGATAQALRGAAPLGVGLGVVFGLLEISARAWRWRFLLSPLGKVDYRHSLVYMFVGCFANTLLPMRIGDLARAYLAASALRLSRIATVGSVVTERLADGLTILALAAALGLLVTGALETGQVELWALLGAVLIALAGGLWLFAQRHPGLVASLIPARVRNLAARLIEGSTAARTPRGFLTLVCSTLVAFVCTVSAVEALTWSVGLSLSPQQAAFVSAWIALSTAIPAAPGSVGTYEFVGVSALVLVHQDPTAALAAIVLIHAVGMLPGALIGLVTTWVLHLGVSGVNLTPATLQPEVA